MGLDVSIYLIVGVPLLALGEIEEETETVELVTALGKPTGNKFDIKRIYIRTPKKKFFIGTNEHSINEFRSPIKYDFEDLFLDYEELENWTCRGEDDLNETVIGLPVETIKTHPEDYSRLEKYRISTLEQIQDRFPEVSEFLKERFGYEGQIYVFGIANYSY